MLRRPEVPLPTAFGRAMAELAIIVAGVLIALGAQSWWEDREVEEDRRRALHLLEDDLVQLEASLRDSTESAMVYRDTRALLEGRPAQGDSALAQQLQRALWAFGFNIGTRDGAALIPSYADLKSSGRLYLLPDTIRARMPHLELQLTVLSSFLDDLVHFQQTRVDPILYEGFELDPSRDFLGETAGVIEPGRDLAILEEVSVRNRLLLKAALLRDNLNRFRATADSVAVVRALVGEVLDSDQRRSP